MTLSDIAAEHADAFDMAARSLQSIEHHDGTLGVESGWLAHHVAGGDADAAAGEIRAVCQRHARDLTDAVRVAATAGGAVVLEARTRSAMSRLLQLIDFKLVKEHPAV